ncbi:MAG TPA: hypothetical protein VJT74_17515 [Pyrinomonadaceae bacterium]|nr:hypothetical protein [Pyrinomonadaceae bacterium]
MNSTKDQELLAAEFFEELLAPLAKRERDRAKSFFPLGADPQAESYYAEPPRRVMRASDFELRAAQSLADFVTELAALWAGEGNEELAALAPRLLALAEEMNDREEQAEDVSPFMYVMF